MTAVDLSALLIDAPVGRHFAQLHRKSDTLVKSVGLFVESGLRRGKGVVVIATQPHTDRFLEYLGRTGIDPEMRRRSGQLILRDAEATLKRFMHGDCPDWREFRVAVGSLIESLRAAHLTSVCAYGEMVNVLWKAGKHASAIKLEEYWNELAKIYPFSLFCGYMMDSCDPTSYDRPLHDIGRTHTHVIATEEDERFRAALDAASRDVFGTPLAELIAKATIEDFPGEDRLPAGQRAMLWIARHVPSPSAEILQQIRERLQQVNITATSETKNGTAGITVAP